MTRGWPWLVALGWLVAYELVAVFGPPATLSELNWLAVAAWPWLPIVGTVGLTVLAWHLWYGLGAPDRSVRWMRHVKDAISRWFSNTKERDTL
jgi:hypothetical protein